MVREGAIEHARTALRKRNWAVFDYNNWLTSQAVQSGAKFTLSSVGMSEGYYVASEVRADFSDENSHRVDVVWFDTENWEPSVAFEIDGGVAEHSVDKLRRMDEVAENDVDKVIVSKSPNSTYINNAVEDNLPDDFHHIDVQFYKHR